MTLFQAPLGAVEPVRTKLTANTQTQILASDANNSQNIAKIHVCNIHSSAVTVDLEIYNGSTVFYLEKDRSIAVGASYEIYDEALRPGESLRAKSNHASGLLDISVTSALPRRPGG